MIEICYVINGDEQWIPGTCKVDTPHANLHNIQRRQWQTEPDLVAASTSDLYILQAAVAAMIKTPAACPRAAAAAATMIKTLAPGAVGLTPMEMSDIGTNPGAIMAETTAVSASR